MNVFRASLAAIARLCLSAFFLMSGINKIIYWKAMEKQLLTVFGEWQTHTVSSASFQFIFSTAVIWVPAILMGVTFLEIIGALLLIFGIREKLGATLLAIVLLPMTILMQHFWFVEGTQKDILYSLFLRDIAIFGGLLIVILQGARGGVSGMSDDSSMI